MASPNKNNGERTMLVLSKEHAALTATTAAKLMKARKRMRIERVDYINPTGLAADATNAFKLEVKNGATVVATVFNTDSDDVPAGAALAVDTFVTASNGTASARTLAADDVLSLAFTEDGTATLPAGTVVIWFTELN